MMLRTLLILASGLFVFLLAPVTATPAAASDLLVAQQGPMMQGQGMQGQGMPGQGMPGQGMPPGQTGGQGGNNACMQSYQRCVMMCAGVANCINNCNVGYAVCTQPKGGQRGGGS